MERCAPEEAHKFGIVSLKASGDGPLVTDLVEKPVPDTLPSNLFISGRYIIRPEIFDLLESPSPGAGGEIQLTDAMIALMTRQTIRPFESAATPSIAAHPQLREFQPAHGTFPRRPGCLRHHGNQSPDHGTKRGRLQVIEADCG